MSRQTTLCYIEKGDEYLMLHRIKKKNDECIYGITLLFFAPKDSEKP